MSTLVPDASKRLRACLLRSGLSKETVASQQSVSVSQLYSWMNPNNPRFPDCFQLDRICRTLDTDCVYVLSGEYENLIQEFLVGQDKECTAAAKGMVATIATSVLRRPGPRPDPQYYQAEVNSTDAANLARSQLRQAMQQADDLHRIATLTGLTVSKLKRWIRPKNPEGFPDPFTLMAIAKALDVGFSDIINSRPKAQDLEIYLANLSKTELLTVKEFAATMLASVYRL